MRNEFFEFLIILYAFFKLICSIFGIVRYSPLPETILQPRLLPQLEPSLLIRSNQDNITQILIMQLKKSSNFGQFPQIINFIQVVK